jgi:hypothetical protein
MYSEVTILHTSLALMFIYDNDNPIIADTNPYPNQSTVMICTRFNSVSVTNESRARTLRRY